MAAKQCDILVCGAGPAGSAAARAAAKTGAKVLVVERRAVIGEPVRCAEYIPAPLVAQADVGTDYIVQKTTAMLSFLHNEQIQDLTAPGYVIERNRFDQALAHAAQEAGATFLLNTRVERLLSEHEVEVVTEQGKETIQAGFIIAADGPLSRIASSLGLPKRQLLPAIQGRLPLTKPLSKTRIYFDESLKAGYAWLFPKGQYANIGLGIVRSYQGQPLWRHLENFIEDLREEGLIEHSALTHVTGGWVPVQPLARSVYGSVLLAGDAAGHTHPITGAGIFQAVSAGSMAGEWAGKAIVQQNKALINDYDEEWQDLYGDVLAHAYTRRLAWQAHMGPLDEAIRRFWIGFREYYARSV